MDKLEIAEVRHIVRDEKGKEWSIPNNDGNIEYRGRRDSKSLARVIEIERLLKDLPGELWGILKGNR